MSMNYAQDQVLRQVDFGRLDAEQDNKLLEYFIEVGTASQALQGRYLVIGRKGAGKTALFRHVAANAPGRVIELDLKDYVFQAHKGLRDTGVSEAFAYAASWRFAIAISMFLESASELGFFARLRGNRILRSLGASPSRAYLGAIMDWLRRVRKVKLPSIAGLADLGGLEIADAEGKFFDTATGRLLDELEELLASATKKKPITVLIDRLDDAWDGTDDSLRLIGGAARAARHFSDLFKQNGVAPVIVFLRTDLWERIAFNDKNKFVQDTVYLGWNNEDLAAVIDERIHKTAGVEKGQGWATCFTNREMRQRSTPRTYMLKRVLGRPRDIVAFSIFARDVALANGHLIIEGQDIYEAEVRYSKHILDELRDEIGAHVPSMVAVINAMKALERRTFTLSAWEIAARSSGIAEADVAPVLEQLFEASAVGVHRAGGSTGGSKTIYRYQDRFLKATETGTLQVHPALTKELGLTDA